MIFGVSWIGGVCHDVGGSVGGYGNGDGDSVGVHAGVYRGILGRRSRWRRQKRWGRWRHCRRWRRLWVVGVGGFVGSFRRVVMQPSAWGGFKASVDTFQPK